MYIRDLLTYAINVVLSIVQAFLGLRLILKLLGASPEANFVDWLYKTTDPLLEPFAGAFPTPVLERGIIIEFSTLFAMIAYAIAGYLLVELINFVYRATQTRRANRNNRAE